MEKLISIIIPHYNSVDLLLKLLECIPNDPRIEVVVVDDNSNENLDKLYRLQKIYEEKSVRFIFNDTGKKGAGVCRNIGLDNSCGKWILFADADDLLLDGWFETVISYTEQKNDIVYFPPTSIDLRTNKPSTRHIVYEELVKNYLQKNCRKTEIELRFRFTTIWSKMIKRSLIENHCIRFDEIMVSNDIMFMTKCAFYANEISADEQPIYCITRSANTLTSSKSEENFLLRVDVLVHRYHFLEDNLNKQDFKMAHIDRYALARLVDVIFEKMGLKMLHKVMKIYKNNHIKWFDIGLLNPITLFHNAKIEILWWIGIKKSRTK